jgi:hypothetical protein
MAVAVVARTELEISRTAAEIEARGGSAAAIVGDVAHVESAPSIVAEAEDGVRVFAIEPGVVRTEMNESLLSRERTGAGASVIQMLERMEADPGFVEAEKSGELVRLAATGRADDLAGKACSIYDPDVRVRVSTAQ